MSSSATVDRPRIAVLDYGIGNLRSAQKALEHVGADAVLTALRHNPAISQARLLTRILAAYIGRQVSFRSAEVAAFDREHLALLVALMDTHDAGTLPATEWQRAADEAEAAQRDIGG